VFPLRVALQYQYEYTGVFSSWNYGSHSSGTDSGTVSCQVADSSLINDTTIEWTVIERRHLVSRRSSSSPPRDTTFLTDDSTGTILREFTTEHHAILSSTSAWVSPSSSPFPGAMTLYRYAESSPRLSTIGGGPCTIIPANFDSAWQSSDSGLFRRSYSRCFDNDEIGDYELHDFRLKSVVLVGVHEQQPLPTQVRLLQNFPNPFNSTTEIVYELAGTANVRIVIHDILGRQITVLTEGIQPAGRYTRTFDASGLSTGMYIVRLQIGSTNTSMKMVLLR
jgi:hypothetical protein